MVDDNKQPVVGRGRTPGSGKAPGTPSLFKGGIRSVNRLRDLKFDPIGVLVDQYKKIEIEIQHQEEIKNGRRIILSAKGNPMSYRPEVHHALFDKLINIGEKLLRYGYGRVPETSIIEEKRPQPLIVNLTKKGDTYIVNEDDQIIQPGIDDWDEEERQ